MPPSPEIAGLKIRPISSGTFKIARTLKLAIGTGASIEGATDEELLRQMVTLLFVQAAPLDTVLKAAKVAERDLAAFESEFLIPWEMNLPVDVLPAAFDELRRMAENAGRAADFSLRGREGHKLWRN